MLAFFSIIIAPDGSHEVMDGSLHNPPPELRDGYRIQQYLKIREDGWHVSEFGYLCLRKSDRLGCSYLFPGLYVTDGPRPNKKFYSFKPQYQKSQVERYLSAHLEQNAHLRFQAESEMTTLIHDLRHLSTAIYHSAEQAERAFREDNRSELSEGLKTIVATQTMLKARIDYLDYASDVDRFEVSEKIPVYSRVDKVVRCFQAAAADKRISLRLSGESFRLAQGPNILDIVPYTIVDNAIKYSPENHEVHVQVYDTEDATIVSISSVGPYLVAAETDRIFDRGFRGGVASRVRPAGTGLGLSVAKEIVEKFSGYISAVGGGEVREFDGIRYHDVEFKFCIPSRGDDITRRKRSRRGRAALRAEMYKG